MKRGRPDYVVDKIAGQLLFGARLSSADRERIYYAVRDLSHAYKSLRTEHIGRCRCAVQMAQAAHGDRVQLAAISGEIRELLDELDQRLSRLPLPSDMRSPKLSTHPASAPPTLLRSATDSGRAHGA